MVYFLHSNAMNAVKIGWTENIRTRERSIRAANPEDLVLLATIEGGRSLEKELHKKFEHLRIRGEWFRCNAELMIHIDDLTGGELWQETFHLRDENAPCFEYGDGDMPSF